MDEVVIMADLATTGAVGAVTTMLAGLFALFVRAMGEAARRSDAAAESRVTAETERRLAAETEARYWRNLYLGSDPKPEGEIL